MNILLLTGSPHVNGASNTLASSFEKGAGEVGHLVSRFDAAKANLHPCIGCNIRQGERECVQKDDGAILREKVLNADALVFVEVIP